MIPKDQTRMFRQPLIDMSPARHFDNLYNEAIIQNFVNNSVESHASTVAVLSAEFYAALAPGLFGKKFDSH